MELFHQTKVAGTCCVGSCVERSDTAARSIFTRRSSTNSSTSRRKPWATSLQKSGHSNQKSKKCFAGKKRAITKHAIEASNSLRRTLQSKKVCQHVVHG